jgi:hypothetical protein
MSTDEKPIEELTKEEFVAKQLLQIWLLGQEPHMCLTYCQGLRNGLTWSGFGNLYEDFDHLFDLLEFHEQAGQLPSTLEGILAIVKQFYGERDV